MKEDRDKIDDLFRSKLYDFESDALPDEVWEKIEGRLAKQSHSLPAASRWKWWSAAAAIALLVLSSTVYLLRQEPIDPVLVQEIKQKTEEVKSVLQEQEQSASTGSEPVPVVIAQVREEQKPAVRSMEIPVATAAPVLSVGQVAETTVTTNEDKQDDKSTPITTAATEITDQLPEETVAASLQADEPEKTKKMKRWNFGMGAGSFTAGSNDAANIYAFRNSKLESPHLDFLNSIADKNSKEAPKTDIKHRQPISVGLSASYMLTPRWYLMAGVNYAYLSSEWRTNGTYNAKTEQRLHFVGLPVSLAYKIAEWNNFMWYASAGFKPEVNVAGTLKVTNYANDQMLGTPEKENRRMKEWYWSVNAGTGVSYPLWKYLNAFAEVGAGYYFDNGSSIETIHSEKPFNVNLSFGLRLGF